MITRLLWIAVVVGSLVLGPQSNAAAEEDPGPCPINNKVCGQALAYQLCAERTVEYANSTGNSAITPGTCAKGSNYFVCYATISGNHNAGNCSKPNVYYWNTSGPSEDDALGPPDCKANCFGDPINAGNGNKFERRVEFQSPKGPLAFSWTYNSRAASTSVGHGDVLGKGRATVLSQSLAILAAESQQYAAIRRPDGKRFKFLSFRGEWRPINALQARLIHLGTGEWLLEEKDGDKTYFNTSGQLVGTVDPQGRSLAFTRTAAGQVSIIEDDQGRQLRLVYDAVGRLIELIAPDGGRTSFAYSVDGYLAKTGYEGGGFYQYLYDEEAFTASPKKGLLTGTIDETGRRTTSTYYDYLGKAYKTIEGTDSKSQGAIYSIDSLGEVKRATISNANGRQRALEFGVVRERAVVLREVESCMDCADRIKEYVHGRDGAVIGVRRNGVLTSFKYDANSRVVEEVEADGTASKRVTRFGWDGDSNRLSSRSVTNASGVIEFNDEFSYDGYGNRVKHVAGVAPDEKRTTWFGYCSQIAGECLSLNQLIYVDGPLPGEEDQVRYVRYSEDAQGCNSGAECPYRRGDLWKVVDALGASSEHLAYDGAGRPISVKDRNGVVTEYAYTARGWLASIAEFANGGTSRRTTSIEYLPNGLVQEVISPVEGALRFSYDTAKQLVNVRNVVGDEIIYGHDAEGNVIAEEFRDNTGVVTRVLTRVIDAYGQLRSEKSVSDSPLTASYDSNGRMNSIVDGLGRSTVMEYDPLGRLINMVQDVGGIGARVTKTFDGLGNAVKIVDPKALETRYVRNSFGEIVSQFSPDTGRADFTYDAAGNVKTRTDARGVTASYNYDAFGRLLAVRYADPSSDIFHSYDVASEYCLVGERYSLGRMSAMKDASGGTVYCYNAFGEVSRKVHNSNGVSLHVRYEYSPGGALAVVVYPDGAVVDYVRNVLGRIEEVGVALPGRNRQILVSSVSYLPFGSGDYWRYGNGRGYRRTFDLSYRPVSIYDSKNDLGLVFGYDKIGNIALLGVGEELQQITYDALGRITAFRDASADVTIESYSYESSGDRTMFANSLGESVYTYSPDSHHLLSVDGIDRVYDAAGNTISIGGALTEFFYGAHGRLSMVSHGGVAAQYYAYNGRGERTVRWLGNDVTLTVYDEKRRWLGDYDASGALRQQVVWMDDQPIGLLTDDQVFYIEPDHIGSPRVLVDPQRDTAIWRWDLNGESFGSTLPNEDPDGDGLSFVFNMRFPGQIYDSISGSNQNNFRDYDPVVGRYLQADPIGLFGGINAYTYVDSNPFLFTDRLGLAKDQACLAGYTAMGAACGGTLGYYGGGVSGGLAGGAVCSPSGPGAAVCAAGGAAGGSALGGALGSAVGGVLGHLAGQATCSEDEQCPPCRTVSGQVVAVGTIGYRLDIVPPGKPHYPYAGSHYNLYKANQNPRNCQCFWQEVGAADAAGGLPPPQGSIPISPFVN